MYQDALKCNPHSTKVYRLLIECYEQYGEYNYSTFKNIIESYKKLSLIEVDNPVNHFELGRYNLFCNQFDQAVKEYNILKTVDYKLAERLNYKINRWQEKLNSINSF